MVATVRLFRLLALFCCLLATMPTTVLAWGPHPEITRAALSALTESHPLRQILGNDTERLTQYVWMGDWRQQLLIRTDEVFYADDFLLFPKVTRHLQHICPEVEQTYSPYFRRALQALQTESPRNAARWLGAILHFTTDTGSPPHAAGFLGIAHSKMENWVDPKAILIPGYKPTLLGNTPDTAVDAFVQRMQGLIAFSKARAERCRADVDADRRAAVEPVVLESALETARVTADLLHTLGTLASHPTHSASLFGSVKSAPHPDATLRRLPIKITLNNTDRSTLTEPDGSFSFRNLPPGSYRATASAPGIRSLPQEVELRPSARHDLSIELAPNPTANLLRNHDFRSRWLNEDGFDHWHQRALPAKLAAASGLKDWNSEWIPLDDAQTYECMAIARTDAPIDATTRIFLRTKPRKDSQIAPVETEPIDVSGAPATVLGSADSGWMQVCIRTSVSPSIALQQVVLRKRDRTP